MKLWQNNTVFWLNYKEINANESSIFTCFLVYTVRLNAFIVVYNRKAHF